MTRSYCGENVQFDLETAVDQQIKACDQTFYRVSDLECQLVCVAGSILAP